MQNSFAKAFIGFSTLALAIAAPASPASTANPFPSGNPFPLANGFPDPSPSAIADLEIQAHGNLPGGSLPPHINASSVNRVYYLAFHELTESAFFSEVVYNITNKVHGFEVKNPKDLKRLTTNLITIQGSNFTDFNFAVFSKQQEELHVVSAQAILEHYTNTTIAPCHYDFPVSTLEEAIELAAIFSSVGSATLQDVILTLAANGDVPFTGIVASVLAQEGEQAGYYRVLQDKVPSEAVFFTPTTGPLTYSWLNTFTIPGTCPNISTIPITITPPLNLLTIPTPTTSRLRFSGPSSAVASGTPLWLVYLNQANLPIVENVTVVETSNASVTWEATFPFPDHNLFGLTTALITNSSGPFETAAEVAARTVLGPAYFDVE